MPKAATRQKSADKTAKTSPNGKGKTAAELAEKHEFDDFVEVEQAIAEYNARRSSQLAAIKKTDKKLLRQMLYQMVLGRRFEEKCAEVYRMGKIGGFCHLYIGQEAIGIGALLSLDPKDMRPPRSGRGDGCQIPSDLQANARTAGHDDGLT